MARKTVVLFLFVGIVVPAFASRRNSPIHIPISLVETITPTAILDADDGEVAIRGTVSPENAVVRVRVTTSWGLSAETRVVAENGKFKLSYPGNFHGISGLEPGMLFIDATADRDFNCSRPGHFQAEIAVILFDSKKNIIPDLPSAFTNDLLDRKGQRDEKCSEYPVIRQLVNLYMRSQAAGIADWGRADFDLAKRDHYQRFIDNYALYDFTYRDRDWSKPLNNRVARTFWQAVWTTWFNSSNNDPLDGNPKNYDSSNYRPYTFANDFSDILMCYLMRKDLPKVLDDNLDTMCREGLSNLIAMQHRGEGSFALKDRDGREHHYTRGAFHYGMFDDGTWLTEGKGWFYNPHTFDYINGGVFNGRSTWGLGEGLKRYSDGEMGKQLREAIGLSVKYCLHDALEFGYAHKTPNGNLMWMDPGEQGYLLLGMLAACEVAPNLVVIDRASSPRTLKDFCVSALNAIVDEAKPEGGWMAYADKDSMAIAALADGVRVLEGHPDAQRWRNAAVKAADGWVNATVDSKEHPAPLVHFSRRQKPDRLSFIWGEDAEGKGGHHFIFFYKTGHWIHALSKMYGITGDCRYRDRCEAMIRYLCGANPFCGRMLNEMGGVYNWVEDTDGDGIEDELKQDMYPESTCFTQIGIWHLLKRMPELKTE